MTEAAPGIGVADLERLGLASAGEAIRLTPMAGGVSSEICRVESGGRVFVVKRALSRLRVADEWHAPVERNRHEADWLEVVERILPGAAPRVIARDDQAGLFAMEYFDPLLFPVWKEQLRDGRVDCAFAAAVGRNLATIHARTAGDSSVAERFSTDAVFHALRLEPYFEAAARRHPAVAAPLLALSAETLGTRLALAHGDVSPKNILAGPSGPVFLDAECAWYGDPAFDLAFCLNHLLLKCLWNPGASARLLEAFQAVTAAYLDGVEWEPREAVERRTARLLGGLLLARVDGKSPVEYLRDPEREFTRMFALAIVVEPLPTPDAVARLWASKL